MDHLSFQMPPPSPEVIDPIEVTVTVTFDPVKWKRHHDGPATLTHADAIQYLAVHIESALTLGIVGLKFS